MLMCQCLVLMCHYVDVPMLRQTFDVDVPMLGADVPMFPLTPQPESANGNCQNNNRQETALDRQRKAVWNTDKVPV